MATFIKSISFQNFYNYYGSFNDNTYLFKEGINIINADNNMGKSKFFNGILWILKDDVYDSDLKKMVPAVSSFQKMASGKAINENVDFDMGVNITFFESNSKYSVTKAVQFFRDSDGWGTNQKLDVMQTIDNRDIPVLDASDKNKVINKIIPVELINYALLQGESMEELVDLSSQNGLSSTIEALAGVKNLVEVCDISREVTQKIRRVLNHKERETSASNQRVNELIQRRETLQERIDQTEKQIDIYKTELSVAESKKEQLEAVLLNAQKREKFRGVMKTLSNEINQLREKKNIREREITSMLFCESSPWLLMGLHEQISLFDSNRQKYTFEIATQKAIHNPVKLPEGSPDVLSLQRMIDKGWCEVCDREAPKHSPAWLHMKKVLERPSNNKNINKNDFSSFYGSIQKNIGAFALSIPNISKTIQKYREDLYTLEDLITRKEDEKEHIKLELLNVGGSETGSDIVDKRSVSEYSLAEKSINENNKLIKEALGFIKQWKTILKQDEVEVRKNSTNIEIEKYRQFRDIMESVEDIFFNSKERIFDEILNSLEINANKKYIKLTQGNLAAGGKLNFSKQANGTVQVSIKDVNDGLLTGLGTGFQRMKQLSIIMAIISSKIGTQRFDYPFISDAPFSEFGDNFINNFFETAPNVFRQSIILIKELYDPKSDNFLNDLGMKILIKMENGEIPGTFYVNIIEEEADTTNLVTKNKCYKG